MPHAGASDEYDKRVKFPDYDNGIGALLVTFYTAMKFLVKGVIIMNKK